MFELFRKYRAYLLCGYAFLLLIHFGFKDHYYVTGIFFYPFPLPILILLTIPLLVLYYPKKSMRFTLIALACVMSFYWVKNYYINYGSNISGHSKSMLFWNIAKHKDYNIKVLKKVLETKNIDVILFVEAIHKGNDFNEEFKQLLSDYSIEFLEGDMLIASKKGVKVKNYIEELYDFKFNHLQVDIGSYLYDFVLVDVFAKPLHNKRDALTKILNYSKEQNIEIVLGDFNTPYESTLFENFEPEYQSARAYQKGFSATWPLGFPLLEIDQIWMTKDQKIIKTEKAYYDESDHAMMITYFK